MLHPRCGAVVASVLEVGPAPVLVVLALEQA